MIELSLRALIDNFPASATSMSAVAEQFNDQFAIRWSRVVEFLKLHYVLSQRNEPYWQAHRDPGTFPERLSDLLALWRERPPSAYDLPLAEEIFPAASYQYVYYGMGGALPPNLPRPNGTLMLQIEQLAQRSRSLVAALPSNRAYFSAHAADTAQILEDRA
jgi:hypothetical protein